MLSMFITDLAAFLQILLLTLEIFLSITNILWLLDFMNFCDVLKFGSWSILWPKFTTFYILFILNQSVSSHIFFFYSSNGNKVCQLPHFICWSVTFQLNILPDLAARNLITVVLEFLKITKFHLGHFQRKEVCVCEATCCS